MVGMCKASIVCLVGLGAKGWGWWEISLGIFCPKVLGFLVLPRNKLAQKHLFVFKEVFCRVSHDSIGGLSECKLDDSVPP